MSKNDRTQQQFDQLAERQQRRRVGYRRAELAQKIIRAIGNASVPLALLLAPNAGPMFEIFGEDFLPADKKYYKQKERIRRALERLKRKRIVSIHQKGIDTIVELTQAGKKRLLIFELDSIELVRQRKWDGMWRFIIFDIPESKRRARDALTATLYRLGFMRLQKSVWVTPHPCRDELDFVAELFEIGDYVHYLEVRYIDDEEKLKLHFFKGK